MLTIKINKILKCVKVNELKELLNNKSISEETIIFNNLVKTKIDYMNNWERQLKK